MIRKTLAMVFMTTLGVLWSSSEAIAQGPREGIVVHGHWLLEVRNPDGTVAERREFENGLKQGGQFLISLLRQQVTMGNWRIYLGTRDRTQQPAASDDTSPFVLFSDSSVLATVSDGSSPGSLILTADVKATETGTIKDVLTMTSDCSNDVAPASCKAPFGEAFSGSTVKVNGQPSPLPLVKGQIVQVTVTISFTSAP